MLGCQSYHVLLCVGHLVCYARVCCGLVFVCVLVVLSHMVLGYTYRGPCMTGRVHNGGLLEGKGLIDTF